MIIVHFYNFFMRINLTLFNSLSKYMAECCVASGILGTEVLNVTYPTVKLIDHRGPSFRIASLRTQFQGCC